MTPNPRRPLLGLLIAQFTCAFNDNAWKLIVTFLAIAALPADANRDAMSQSTTTWAFVVFTLPLLVFSLPAGMLADRFAKRSVIIALKGVEVVLMAAGTLALALAPKGGIPTFVVLGLMGLQSALFSPAKYGILPELVPHDRLAQGNGQLELWTFLAIILGTATGGLILESTSGHAWLAGVTLCGFAALGLLAAFAIPTTSAPPATQHFRESVSGAWHAVRGDRVLMLAMLGSACFWLLASLLGQDLLVYAKVALGLADHYAGMPMAVFGIGVGAGSVLAGRLSRGKVEYGLIPLGAAMLAVFTLLLGWLAPALKGTLVLMALLGIASGLVVVPIESILQWRAPADRRGAVIALSNVFTFAGVLAGSLGALFLSKAGLDARGIFVGAAIATMVGTTWALTLLPVAFLRVLLVLLTHTIYRVRTIGRERVPGSGGALLVPNHVSFVDALFLIVSIDRPIRFLVDAGWFSQPLLKPFMNLIGAIPIAAGGGPRQTLRALRNAGEALDRGELVCIFAEGQITRIGALLPFRRGLERILKGRTATVIPIFLDGLWGSIFSRSGGRFLWKWPRQIPYPVTIAFGEPLPASTPIEELRRAVMNLGTATAESERQRARPLHHEFLAAMRRNPFKLAFSDASRPHVSRMQALTGSILLARRFAPYWSGQERVGCLLPPSVAGALVNIAASLSGRTIVNLNYTVGASGLTSAARQADLLTVVTSDTFLERAKVSLPEGVTAIKIEDVLSGASWLEKLAAFAIGLCLPKRWVERACGASRPVLATDLVTVIFSSGSTGEPKGVMLTHFNIASNVKSVCQVVPLGNDDRVLGILPLFHSFGYLLLWVSAQRGLPTIFHANPLDAIAVGELVEHHRLTLLLATPTFLQLYLRRCTPGQFGSLRFVVAGAEKLQERLSLAFEERFGVRPLEGYGATECSPVVALSIPGYRAPGFYQSGTRRGSVGQPVPGVALKIVDPDTRAPLPVGQAGLLLVRGPNVMQGYLKREDLTRQVLVDGWYVTGDIARVDEDGFLEITDRLARFSKIGGEMVPHGRVEQALHEAAQSDVQVFAVTATADERKGEALAVLHTLEETRIATILERVTASGLPNLFVPRRERFVRVDKLPVLGTGKIDLREVKRVAAEKLKAE